MTKAEVLLPVEMGKLEIEPAGKNVNRRVDNPFVISQDKKKFYTQKILKYSKCTCAPVKKDITVPIFKKRSNKLIKEPVLKLLQDFRDDTSLPLFTRVSNKCVQSTKKSTAMGYTEFLKATPDISLHTLVDDCNQLKISSDFKHGLVPMTSCEEKRWCLASEPLVAQNRDSAAGTDKNWATPSCSQEALNPPCDVTIDELASYFETLVHIPKKMSSMAEMMYI